jgi:small subunit ribosomal protein S11
MTDIGLETNQLNEDQSGEGSGSGSMDSIAEAVKAKSAAKSRKKFKRHVTDIIINIFASFNNTVITVADTKGNTLSWATAGGCGFRGSRKSTPYAGQVATAKALQKAKDLYGAETAEVKVYGPGPGRDASVRVIRDFVMVTLISDVTGIPHNGCRPEKQRRV